MDNDSDRKAEIEENSPFQEGIISEIYERPDNSFVQEPQELKDLIDTVHRMQNFTTWNEKTFAGKLHDWMELYTRDEGVRNYAINSILFLTTVREKYVRMYERFIKELKLYSRAIRVLSKGYLPISLLPPSKLEKILNEVRIAIMKSNKDYDLVLTRLYLYYGHEIGNIWN